MGITKDRIKKLRDLAKCLKSRNYIFSKEQTEEIVEAVEFKADYLQHLENQIEMVEENPILYDYSRWPYND